MDFKVKVNVTKLGKLHTPAPIWSARDLPNLPDFLAIIIARARQMLDLERLVVFGSRARGDHNETSDYDLCFYLNSSRNWAEFVLETQETAGTLCALDMVKFDTVDSRLADEIARNGVPLYERQESTNIPS